MLHIKKYANGRFFDTSAKEYIRPEKLAEMIQEGEGIQVTLAKTGKDITDTVIGQFSEKEDRKPAKGKIKIGIPFLKTGKMTKWMGAVVDTKIEKLMGIINLPSREQVAVLNQNINELHIKIDALELSQGKSAGSRTGDSDMQMPSPAAFAEKGSRNSLADALNAAA